jgi:hypothetical protein
MTPCELCADLTRMADRHWPLPEITDYTAMDPATLGRHLRSHGRAGVATYIDPTHDGGPGHQLDLPGVDYARPMPGPKHERTCPQQCGYCEQQILTRDNG